MKLSDSPIIAPYLINYFYCFFCMSKVFFLGLSKEGSLFIHDPVESLMSEKKRKKKSKFKIVKFKARK